MDTERDVLKQLISGSILFLVRQRVYYVNEMYILCSIAGHNSISEPLSNYSIDHNNLISHCYSFFIDKEKVFLGQ